MFERRGQESDYGGETLYYGKVYRTENTPAKSWMARRGCPTVWLMTTTAISSAKPSRRQATPDYRRNPTLTTIKAAG
jgi:hypothetical protein